MRVPMGLLAMGLATVANASVILPMGDSVTVGQYSSGWTPGGWRSRLELLDPTVRFVGPATTNPGPGQLYPYHCAFAGSTCEWPQGRSAYWGPSLLLADTVVLQLGTNDVMQNKLAMKVLNALETSVRALNSFKPGIRIVIATILYHRDGSSRQLIDTLNDGIVDRVRELRRDGLDAMVAPAHECSEPAQDMLIDLIHPNAAGYDRMAAMFSDAIKPLPGDVDGDGLVSLFDYLLLTEAFDSQPGTENWNPAADLDQDSQIGLFDYLILSENFDRTKFVRQ